MIDINEIRERCNAATPAPWKYIGCNYNHVKLSDGVSWSIGSDKDAEFIARARDDVPALLDEVERLQIENTDLKSQLDDTVKLLLETIKSSR